MSDNNNNNKLIRWEPLPSEIATDIFLRLPIKSIIICTSVSKTWKSLIQNPTFISTHLHHSHNKNKNLLVFSLYSHTHKESYALHNEDDPDFTQHARHLSMELGIGLLLGGLLITTFNILFWVFDLGNEVLREILLPELPDYSSKFAGLLSVFVSAYGNSIALFQNGYFSLVKGVQTGDFYLWVMEEYGVASSWTKVSNIGEGLPRPIGFKRNGEVVLLSYDGQLVSWVPWSTEFKHLEIIGYEDTFVDCYVESLVLLDNSYRGFMVFHFILYIY